MMKWRIARLDEVAEVSAGNPAPQDQIDFCFDGLSFVRMQDVGREHHTKNLLQTIDQLTEAAVVKNRLRLFPKGTLLIPKSGASVNLNHRALLGKDAYVVSHLATAVPNEKVINPEFLYYWSLSYDPRHQAQTTSLPSLPTSLIKAAPVPIPALDEQLCIVDLLSRADGIVRLRSEAQRKAIELIPAIFLDMFGDPATNQKGWPVVLLDDLITKGPQNGLYKHSSFYGSGTPILRIDAFYDGLVSDFKNLKRLRLDDSEHARFSLVEGDLVINRVNSPEYLGKSALIPALQEAVVFESNMMRFAVDQHLAEPAFIIQLLQTRHAKGHFLTNAKHAINQSSINQQDVKSLTVPVPPLAMQQAFTRHLNSVASIIAQQAEASGKAKASFDALLANAFVEA